MNIFSLIQKNQKGLVVVINKWDLVEDKSVKVQKAFENLSKDKTVIMIAHRLSTVTNADRIYVLKDGAIAEEGSHGELLKSHGIYAHMWEEYNKSVNWKVGGVL